MKAHLHRTRRTLLSINKWKLRVVFFGGAITIGLAAALFALASFEADELYRSLYQQHPLLMLLIPPFGLAAAS